MTKTIFHPGKSVTTTWLNGSQYLGPSNPGVVFVPNPVNDWEYPLLKGTSVDLLDFSQYFVARSGDQSIDDVKTFTSIPTFPTSTQSTGLQGVNVTRLITELTTLTTAFNNSLAGYVTLGTNQTISGTKTFSALEVPLVPIGPTSPVSLQHFDDNAVKNTGNQTINGTKSFADIQVPANPTGLTAPVSLQYFQDNAVINTGTQTVNGAKTFANLLLPDPTAPTQAVNKQTLDAALAALIPVTKTNNNINFGNLQIVWGQTQIFGSWGAVGPLGTGVSNISAYAPGAAPFVQILSYSAVVDRLVPLQMLVSLTTVEFWADDLASAPQPNDGTIAWIIIGLTA